MRYFKGLTGRLRLRTEQYSEDSSTRGDRSTVQDSFTSTEKGITEEARDKMPQEKGSLRRIQEPEYRTERITSLVYVM
jgi:hypothetical protein